MLANEIFELSGKITFDDLLKFYYFETLRKTWWFWALISTCMIMLIVTVVVFTILSHGYEVARPSLPIVLACLFFLTLKGVPPYVAARREYQSNMRLDEPMVVKFSSAGVHAVSSNSSGDTSWKAFWRICEAKSFFCLYYSAGSAWILPKRFFVSSIQQDQWRELVEAQIQPKKIEKPGMVGKLL